MTEDQAFEAIKNAIRLENLSRETAAKVTKQLLEVFEEAKRAISRIDTGDPLREQRLRQVLQQLAPLFRGPNDRLYLELTSALREEVERQAQPIRNAAGRRGASQRDRRLVHRRPPANRALLQLRGVALAASL